MRVIINGSEILNRFEDVSVDFPGITFIAFSYPEDFRYYDTPYVQECMRSWRRCANRYKGACRLVNIIIDDEVKSLSKWSQNCYGNKKYITDSLRVYFVNKFDNCIYLDTDVFLSQRFLFSALCDDNDNFVLGDCSGTMLWNKKRNSEILNDFWDFYNTELLNDNKPFWEKGDIAAFNMFNKYRESKNMSTLKSFPVEPRYIGHFSSFYSWIRDEKHIVICLDSKVRETKEYKSANIFPAESLTALMSYIYERKYDIPLVFEIKPGDKVITFV